MEKRLIAFVIEHINRFVRLWVSKDKYYFLTLDYHSSREGWEWLSLCKTVNVVLYKLRQTQVTFYSPVTR